MKRLRALVLLGLLGLSAERAGTQTLDAIVARVDQSVVTWSQVLQEHELRSWAGGGPDASDALAVADALVRRRLLVAEAQKMRIEVKPEELAAEVRTLAEAGGDPTAFWSATKKWGITEADVSSRCRDELLARRYLALRQEMTYVPEADVRNYYEDKVGDLGGTSLSRVREEVRVLLARKKYQQELEQWIAKQVAAGRVRQFEIPKGSLLWGQSG